MVFSIVRQQGKVVTLQSLGRDQHAGLQKCDWVEIMDDDLELRGEPGILAQVDGVDPVELTVTLKPPGDGGRVNWPEYDEKSSNHPLLRRWDQHAIEGVAMSQGAILLRESDDLWIEIERGIEVQFTPMSGEYRTGDYWLIPARVATGDIEWPPELDDKGQVRRDTEGRVIPAALPPRGIEHHYAPLAVVSNQQVTADCRCSFKLALTCPPAAEAAKASRRAR